MGAIVACPIDRNMNLEMPEGVKGLTFSVSDGSSLEFVPLYCPSCKSLCMWIHKDSVYQVEGVWKYK